MAKKKFKKIYRYKCTISDKEFKTTAEAKHPDELLSVEAYYELNPEKDDRPEHIKQSITVNSTPLDNE